METWCHHLEGVTHKFEIWSDHKNLQFFMSSKKLNRRQACWVLYLTKFDFELINKAGSSMGKADTLSRRPDHKEGVEDDNDDVTLLKPEFFNVHALQQGHLLIEGKEEEILSKVRKTKALDEAVVKAVEELWRSC